MPSRAPTANLSAVAASFIRPKQRCHQIRWQSSISTVGINSRPIVAAQTKTEADAPESQLKRLTTWHLIRNIVLAAVLTRPLLFKPSLAAVKYIANSTNPLLNPDRNLLVRAMCAGTTKSEIASTIRSVRNLGFSGVILCYGREITLNSDNSVIGSQSDRLAQLAAWRDGTLETLDMVDEGNWLGIKFTGAGQDVTDALVAGEEAPEAFKEAMDSICVKARARNCRIWIDSEQDAVQRGIDLWTIDLMRKYNKPGQVLVYNTVQAYLKSSRSKLQHQLDLATKEGWTLAVKLVRGAYMATDDRKLIHDTKADTDASYNGIARDIMQGTVSRSEKGDAQMCLFLAGHNSESVSKTLHLGRELSRKNALKVYPEYGQLQGMADDVGCSIVDFREQGMHEAEPGVAAPFQPQVFKCLTWGSISECIQYLVRRAIENSAAVDRMRSTAMASKSELYRRLFWR